MTARSADGKSLHDIMNEMVRTPLRATPRPVVRPQAEEEAFAVLDPLFDNLSKQMRDAQSRYAKLKTKHGANDPMALVACDMAESAVSAVATRLLELRANRALCRAMRRLIRQGEEEAEQEKAKAALQYQMRLQNYYDRQSKADKKSRRDREFQNWILFLMWVLQMSIQEAQKSLSLGLHFKSANNLFDEAV